MQSREDTNKAELILRVLRDIEAFIKREEELYLFSESIGNKTVSRLKINYTQFSDSIILSTEIIVPEINELRLHNINNLMNICSLISYLQARFLNEGILLRGGLTWGPIFHEKNICFGPAFIRAYHLESKYALNPRILIDPDIMNFNIIPDQYHDYDLYPYFIERLKDHMFMWDEEDENYFINFMLLDTFKRNVDSIIKKVNDNMSGLNPEDEFDRKIIDKNQWIHKEINKFKEKQNV
jgi:hypothetical protein